MFIDFLFILGITAEAMSGALAAGRHRMDVFGVLFISFVTALGGGSIRDVLFEHYPLTWVGNPHYIWIVMIASCVAMVLANFINRLERLFLTLDALGLAVFSTLGAKIAIGMGYDLTLAMMAAMITGSFGGILRDLFCNTMPLIFRQELYAVVAMICGAMYWFLLGIFGESLATAIAIIGGFIVRMIAIKYKISLPVFNFEKKL